MWATVRQHHGARILVGNDFSQGVRPVPYHVLQDLEDATLTGKRSVTHLFSVPTTQDDKLLSAIQHRSISLFLRLDRLPDVSDANVRYGRAQRQHLQSALPVLPEQMQLTPPAPRASAAIAGNLFALVLSCWNVLTTKVKPRMARSTSIVRGRTWQWCQGPHY